MRGKLIIIEGGDCSGKTTFMTYLKEQRPDCYYSNEPGGTLYGQKIRNLILNETGAKFADNATRFCLYWASKMENFRKEIYPRLMAGMTVVSDRFEGSTYAYQVGEDHRLESLFWGMREHCFGKIVPLYIHFDVPVSVAIQRAQERVGETNFFDTRGREYRMRVDGSYRRFFEDRRISKYAHRVDANVPRDEMIQSAYSTFRSLVD